MSSKNGALLVEFAEYCAEHPEQRFWQALRNWSGSNFVLILSHTAPRPDSGEMDTFYMEGKLPVSLESESGSSGASSLPVSQ